MAEIMAVLGPVLFPFLYGSRDVTGIHDRVHLNMARVFHPPMSGSAEGLTDEQPDAFTSTFLIMKDRQSAALEDDQQDEVMRSKGERPGLAVTI